MPFDINQFLSRRTPQAQAPSRSNIPQAIANALLATIRELEDLDDNYWDLLNETRREYSERSPDIEGDTVPSRIRDLANALRAIPGMRQEIHYADWNEAAWFNKHR